MKRLLIALLVGVFFFAGVGLGQAAERKFTRLTNKDNTYRITLVNGNFWRDVVKNNSATIFLGGYAFGVKEGFWITGSGNISVALGNSSLEEMVGILDDFYRNPQYRIIPIFFVITGIDEVVNNKTAFANNCIETMNMEYVE